jgi:hypothetical protein
MRPYDARLDGRDPWSIGRPKGSQGPGDVPLSGGVSRHRAGQCSDHAVMSSGLATSSVVLSARRAMERSER